MRKLRMSELNRLTPEQFQKSEKHPFVVVLDNVRSLLNVGSVFRSADAFRAEKIYLGGLTPVPNKEMRKTALGATESVTWEYVEETAACLKDLKEKGYELWAVEQTENAENLLQWHPENSENVALIFGHEVTGIDDEVLQLCDGAIEIPQYGTKHSFNISVSSGIVMWEYIRQLK